MFDSVPQKAFHPNYLVPILKHEGEVLLFHGILMISFYPEERSNTLLTFEDKVEKYLRSLETSLFNLFKFGVAIMSARIKTPQQRYQKLIVLLYLEPVIRDIWGPKLVVRGPLNVG
ncbi:hypothetical protein TNIN_327241 [Trichonephila inaurata madagascariensis]|uniref:Uncharacterized protein n=1 Tax=Trichonephila inaurata madagascariensis TaxID=2747483 RepID=A0A8X6KCI6_9ARAC|nr:hypothetical protein TNIN_327241 [Trichonephila inaurata madagascariensis]